MIPKATAQKLIMLKMKGTLRWLLPCFSFIAHVISYTVWRQAYIYRFVFLLLRQQLELYQNFNFQVFAAFFFFLFHREWDLSITLRLEEPLWNESKDTEGQKAGWRISIWFMTWNITLYCITIIILNLHKKPYIDSI